MYLFVIDGGHRLSVLRSWIEDDYGDGTISQAFFGYDISREQIRVAKLVRELVEARVGKFATISAQLLQPDLPNQTRVRLTALASRALHIQWVSGDAEKAEASFFKINTEGTPLDDIEELLLRNRRRPIAIAARAVIRAGKGHRYRHVPDRCREANRECGRRPSPNVIRSRAKAPSQNPRPLPLGGAKGGRTALQVLIDFMLISARDQEGKPAKLQDQVNDDTGDATVEVLRRSLRLAGWMTGNTNGSLGLHPAVYFYGPSGVHSGPMFMGTVAYIGKKLSNNDTAHFAKFTKIRANSSSYLSSTRT